ncbi:MAG TPA: hypothetical protein VGB75_03460 [Jatrophihabitans sp.]|jgi:hypothetical protein|uniref:hypothetical protein n=1 Tax=Jatrophihabitans sp. TaxID=1932789 RepID=UPI002F01374F
MRRSTTSTVAGLRRAVSEAVEAALSRDAGRFALAAERLSLQDQQRLALTQAWVLRILLEQLHPDGLSSADAQDLLRRCLLSAATWWPQAEASVLVLVLTGTLGLADPDSDPSGASVAVGPAALSQGAALLTADLLSAAGSPLTGYLDAAFAELERAETIELP